MIKQMCHVSRCSVNDLFPTRPKICLKSQLFGKCYNHCNFEHTLVDDKEATKVVTLLEKVIKDPKLAKVILKNHINIIYFISYIIKEKIV